MLENVSLFIFSKGRQSVAEQMQSINISRFFFFFKLMERKHLTFVVTTGQNLS